jgi:hypothetical protein
MTMHIQPDAKPDARCVELMDTPTSTSTPWGAYWICGRAAISVYRQRHPEDRHG